MLPMDRQTFYRLLHSFNQGNYRTRDDGYSLLHLSLNDLIVPFHQFIDHLCEYVFIEQQKSSFSLTILSDIHVYIPFELSYNVVLIHMQRISMARHHCISSPRVRLPATKTFFKFFVMLVSILTMPISWEKPHSILL